MSSAATMHGSRLGHGQGEGGHGPHLPPPVLPHRGRHWAGGAGARITGSHAALRQPLPTSAAGMQLPLQLRLMRRVEQAVTLFSLLLQLALFFRSAASLSVQQHLHQALLLALRGICLLAATRLPLRAWLEYRVPLIAVLRFTIAGIPSQRSAQEGDAVLLARPATPGLAGAAQDWLRVLAGTRLLPMALIGSLLHQPPLAVLAQQAALMARTADSPAFCSTQLLAHPLMQHRVAGLWRRLEAWAPLVAPLAPAASLGQLPEPLLRQLQCVATLKWLQCTAGVLLPTVVAGCTVPAVLREGRATAEEEEAEGEGEAGTRACTPRHGVAAAAGKARHPAAAVCATLRRLDAALQDCCRAACMSPQGAATLAVACSLLAGNLYVFARGAAVRRLRSGA